MYIFVYGSLKKGFSKHDLIEGSQFICKTRTRENFAMVDLHHFPGVIKGQSVSPIYGEVYDIGDSLLDILDEYEGDWYCREQVKLEAGFTAWMYFLRDIPDSGKKYGIVIEGLWNEKPGE
ncbi:MAG: gamma-glutamylcyclotransferase family protein [Methanolobus sp.]|uniref:gamma-glutamylcyclotransferase family protein n=1 Tax=Methanolobus sp. TaxID=1874737 RepID=UPI0027319631|nr:gamma-glutamylcyclotransferase family protein [Methanolobus sp.]MDP2216113.1 gamma-glutamylcyclotransferase family protein [Methanolobus sp.]